MEILITYLFKVTISLSLLTLFYQLVLRSLTFYTVNRVFLLAAGIASFLFPLIDLAAFDNPSPAAQPTIIRWVPSTESVTSKLVYNMQVADAGQQ